MKWFLFLLLCLAECGGETAVPDGAAADAISDGIASDGDVACGRDQQPCCAGDVCEGLRLCTGGVCSAADVWAAGHDEMPFSGVVIHGTTRFISQDAYTFFALWGSGADVWAGGGTDNPFIQGVMFHVTQAPLTLMQTQTQPIYALSGSSSSDIWAGGFDETGMVPALVHWDGTTWSNAMTFVNDADLAGIYGKAPNDAWVACSSNLYHWNGSAWSAPYTVPGLTTTQGLSAIWGAGSNDIWVAGGDSSTSGGFVSHWNGSQWSAPSAIAVAPTAISGSGPADIWIVGRVNGLNDGGAVHFDGSAWSSLMAFAGTPLTAVSAGSPTNAWAVGYVPTPRSAVVMHWNGVRWSAPQSIRGATSLYAVWVPPGQ